jgi:hypothetical protein
MIVKKDSFGGFLHAILSPAMDSGEVKRFHQMTSIRS